MNEYREDNQPMVEDWLNINTTICIKSFIIPWMGLRKSWMS